ncbi:MAG: tripartite tricarboxylate transporter substrate binding protein [Synergistaceae bacterium]|jgi:tripartite-type tricarboxylate transporter receptor subunit TctC|nr:tripartite tricarboxylate transporter substrate binding protein [Synergistaceae bacterium]
MRKVKSLSVAAFVCVLIAAAGAAFAAYPEKSITVLQGFSAGGGSDTLAQLTQPYLEKVIGQSFINQYIPGATGAIAWTQLAKTAKKDAYTLSITNTPMLQTNYIMNSEIAYTIRELEPLANVVTDPGIIVVAKDSPYKTAQEFFQAARDNPGKITVGNSGVGGDDFFTILIFEKNSGLKFQQIPFEGDGPSWQAAMGGKIDASFNNLGITFPQVKAGNLRALAVFSEERYEGLADIPTAKELGYNIVSGSSRGYSAPKGIPAEAREILIGAFKKMAEMPEFRKACADRASIVDLKFGEDYAKMLSDQEAQFKIIWEEVREQYQGK